MEQPGPPHTAFPQYITPGKRPLPPTLQRAVHLMRVGAALAAANGLGTVLLGDSSSTNSATYEVGYIVGYMGWYLTLAGLWLWMAQANKAGKNWARITSTVFFGISSLILLVNLVVDLADAAPGGLVFVTLAVTCLSWTIGLFTVILLWHKKTAPYFKPVPMPYPAYGPGYYHPVPQSYATMQSTAQPQPVTDPWDVPGDRV